MMSNNVTGLLGRKKSENEISKCKAILTGSWQENIKKH